MTNFFQLSSSVTPPNVSETTFQVMQFLTTCPYSRYDIAHPHFHRQSWGKRSISFIFPVRRGLFPYAAKAAKKIPAFACAFLLDLYFIGKALQIVSMLNIGKSSTMIDENSISMVLCRSRIALLQGQHDELRSRSLLGFPLLRSRLSQKKNNHAFNNLNPTCGCRKND